MPDSENSVSTDIESLYTDIDGIEPIAIAEFVDDESGSGALSSTDDWVRANSSPEENDGRSPTNTYFNPDDAPGRYPASQKHRKLRNKRSWQTLANWQDGVQSDISRGSQNWWADKQRWIETFNDQLFGSDTHQSECKRVMKTIDLNRYQSAGISTEMVIVGVLSLLIDADVTDFDNRTLARSNTKELLESLDSDVSEYETVRTKLRAQDKALLFPSK